MTCFPTGSRSAVPTPDIHGGDAAAVARALGLDPASMLDLSASLNPFAPDVSALAVAHLDSLVAYPDDRPATRLLAMSLGVDPGRLVLTNGGAEAIALVAGHLGRGEVVEPEFSLYRRHLSVVEEGAGRWRSNPSNPLGVLAAPGETAAVWDEAFYALATGEWTRGDDEAWRLGSLTKLWACAGLRLGYVIAPDEAAAEAIRARRPRWSVNGLALSLVGPMLEATDLAGWSRDIADLRSRFSAGIAGLGLGVTESAANWVLVHEVAGLREGLAPRGIMVRDCTNFGLPGTVRIALPRAEHLDGVLTAIAAATREN